MFLQKSHLKSMHPVLEMDREANNYGKTVSSSTTNRLIDNQMVKGRWTDRIPKTYVNGYRCNHIIFNCFFLFLHFRRTKLKLEQRVALLKKLPDLAHQIVPFGDEMKTRRSRYASDDLLHHHSTHFINHSSSSRLMFVSITPSVSESQFDKERLQLSRARPAEFELRNSSTRTVSCINDTVIDALRRLNQTMSITLFSDRCAPGEPKEVSTFS